MAVDSMKYCRSLSHQAPTTPPAVPAEPRPPTRFNAVHALILLLEYIAAQYAGSVAAGLGFDVYIGATRGASSVSAAPDSLGPLIVAYGAIVGVPLGVLVVVLQTRYWARSLLRDGSARGIGWTRSTTPAGLPVAATAGLVLAALVSLVMAWMPPNPETLDGPLAELAQGALFARLVLVALAVLVAPVIEEFLFRGAMFAAIARSWGIVASVSLTTLAFVAIHLPDKLHYWPGLAAVALLALTNCALRLRHRSLAPAIACHFVYNLGLLGFSAMALS